MEGSELWAAGPSEMVTEADWISDSKGLSGAMERERKVWIVIHLESRLRRGTERQGGRGNGRKKVRVSCQRERD